HYKGRHPNLATLCGSPPRRWRIAAQNLLQLVIAFAATSSLPLHDTTACRTRVRLASSAYLADFLRLLKTLRTRRDFLVLATAALKRSKSVISDLATCLASFWPQDDALNLATTSASARAFFRSFFGA
ncbi:hypothetical protein Vafri_2248, partial [Volvox africanus]